MSNELTFSEVVKKVIKEFKDPSNTIAIENISKLFNVIIPKSNSFHKLIGDIVISFVCIGAVFCFAHFGYLAKENVGNLITLIIGAIIGSRFK